MSSTNATGESAAARILGIERKTLYRMLDRWGISEAKE